jgi:hypothetical protein
MNERLSDAAVNGATPLGIDEMLAARKMPQRSIPVCMRADVLADIEELERQINSLRSDNDDPRLAAGNTASADELAHEIRDLEAEAAKYTVALRLQAVEREEWNRFVDTHTSENDDGTRKLDLSALTVDIFPKMLVSPLMDADQQARFLRGLTEGQWEEVMQLVFELNRNKITVGKSLTASLAMQPKNAKPGPAAQ